MPPHRDTPPCPASTPPLRALLLGAAWAWTAAACAPAGVGLPPLPDGYDPRTAPEERVEGFSRRVVADPVSGFRPRRDAEFEVPVVSLATARRSVLRIAHDRWGFVGQPAPVPESGAFGSPRILVLGDGHLDATVASADHAAAKVRERLRGARRFASAEVGNMACSDGVSPAWSLLRLHALAPTFRPDVVLVVLSTGDDLLELTDPRGPTVHADGTVTPFDAGTESAADARAEALARSLRVPAGDLGLVRHGLAQADALRDPDLRRQAEARMVAVLDGFVELSSRHDFALVFALLPSFARTFPDKIARIGPEATAIVRSATQDDAAAWLLDRLGERGLPAVDLVEEFRWIGPVDLYTAGFQIHTAGHRRLAEAVLPLVRDALDAQAAARDGG